MVSNPTFEINEFKSGTSKTKTPLSLSKWFAPSRKSKLLST